MYHTISNFSTNFATSSCSMTVVWVSENLIPLHYRDQKGILEATLDLPWVTPTSSHPATLLAPKECT